MIDEVREILIDEETLKKTVSDLAERINADYKGKKIVLLIILKGSIIFAADLIREIGINDAPISFVRYKSY